MTVRTCSHCREETAHFNGTCAKCQQPAKKEYCSECHISFGLAETRVAIDRTRVVHEDCFKKLVARMELVRVAAQYVH